MKNLILVLLLFLFSCNKEEIVPNIQVTTLNEKQEVVGTPTVNVIDNDALGGIVFDNINKYNNKPYGSLVVTKSNGHPVFDGDRSARFEVRDGDCGWNDGFSDCTTDRSRSELFETSNESIIGKTISYTERIYIPEQIRFRPKGDNLLVLTQVNYSDTLNAFGALTYLVMENNNTLLIRTHKNFTWDWNKNYTITTSPYNKWIAIRYEIKTSTENDGEIKVFVDGILLFTETRPTLITKSGKVFMKFGIYNSFKSRAIENFSTQVVYFDGLEKKII